MKSRPIQYLFELAAIAVLTVLYICLSVRAPENHQADGLETAPITTALFNLDYRQPGLEHERLAGVLLPVRIGLERYGHIPAWNPYISIGEPILNNGFNYLFNPFHSLPVLLSDSFAQGTKIATFIALLLAGYSMWALAFTLRIGALGRMAAAALYLMNGAIAGKFYAGHFQLALSLTWPPLVLAALWWTLTSKNRFAPVSFGIAFALLFFAGNIYYALHTLICAAVIIAFHLIKRNPQPGKTPLSYLSFHWDRLRRVALAGAFAFGLVAIQFFPIWLTRDYVDHDVQKFNPDGTFRDAYELTQTVHFFLTPEETLRTLPDVNYDQAIAVDYSYLGGTVLLLIAGAAVVAVLQRGLTTSVKAPRKVIAIALLLVTIMMVWGAGQLPLLPFLYARIPLLAEFRFLGRAHAIAALWWVVLAGVAIDILWKTARELFRLLPLAVDKQDRNAFMRAAWIAFPMWLFFFIYSASNTSTRLGMALNDVRLLNALDGRRFTSFSTAVLALWAFILIILLLDMVGAVFRRTLLRRGQPAGETEGWRAYGTRCLRIGLLAMVFYAINDIMTVNSKLYAYEPRTISFAATFPDIRQADSSPFPPVLLPHSPIAFEVYEAELRHWGVNEGWLPNSVDGLLSWEAGTLVDLPRWAVVSNAYGGASQGFAQQVVDTYDFERVECYALEIAPGDPCELTGGMSAVLYRREASLPYAFVVPAGALLSLPGRLQSNNVYPADVIAHRQDSITIQAATPPVPGEYYLVVQEASFPGWKVTAGGMELQVNTAQTFRDPLTGDRGFIAVLMPEGSHTYNLWFEPPGLLPGAVISAISLAAMGWYVSGWKRATTVS